jgi:hypothetical protein
MGEPLRSKGHGAASETGFGAQREIRWYAMLGCATGDGKEAFPSRCGKVSTRQLTPSVRWLPVTRRKWDCSTLYTGPGW